MSDAAERLYDGSGFLPAAVAELGRHEPGSAVLQLGRTGQRYISGTWNRCCHLYKIYDGPIGGNTEPYADEVVYSAISNDSYGLPPQNDTYYCKTSFTIQNSEVIDYSFNGDDCIAEE